MTRGVGAAGTTVGAFNIPIIMGFLADAGSSFVICEDLCSKNYGGHIWTSTASHMSIFSTIFPSLRSRSAPVGG